MIKDLNLSLSCISYLGYSSQLPLLLSLFSKAKKINSALVDIVSQIELMQFIRREVKGDLPQQIKDTFFDLLWKYNISDSTRRLINEIRKKNTLLVNENKVALSRLKIKSTSQSNVNYLLFRILRHYGYQLHVENIQIKKLKKSLEHILPQAWKKNWKEVVLNDISRDRDLLNEIEEEEITSVKIKVEYYFTNYIQSLGNLALLTSIENSTTSNKPFKEKLDIYLESESGNPLLKGVVQETKWNVKCIRQNGSYLAKKYFEIFV